MKQQPFEHSRIPVEARRDPRVGLSVPVEIVCAESHGALHGVTRDLGIGGISVATECVYSYRSVRRVVLRLPSGPLRLDAEGCWQRDDHAESTVLTGLRFAAMDEAAVSALWTLLCDRGGQIARFLHGDSDLGDFGVEEAIGLAHASRTRLVRAGRFIYRSDALRSGEASIFVIVRGDVVLQVRVRDSMECPIERLGPGRLFGGLAAVGAGAPPESAIAHSDVELLEIDRGSYEYLLATKPWLAHRLAQAVTRSYLARTRDLLAKVAGELR